MARVRLNLRGLEEVATSREVHAAVDAAAEVVADNARAQGIRVEGVPGDVALPVEVYDGQTTNDMRVNRAQARVVLAHAAGLASQAKNGVLTRAASDAGLVVKSR